MSNDAALLEEVGADYKYGFHDTEEPVGPSGPAGSRHARPGIAAQDPRTHARSPVCDVPDALASRTGGLAADAGRQPADGIVIASVSVVQSPVAR